MKTMQQIYTEYREIVLDAEELLSGTGEGGFRRKREINTNTAALENEGSSFFSAGTTQEALAQLESEIRNCRRCSLCEKRKQAVPGTGVINPLVMVIGEGPGAEEDAKGEPFVGPAGQFLDKWLQAVGLSRKTNSYIANIVKCRPPGNRDPQPQETAQCINWLLRQLELIRPAAVLAVGRVAAQNLLGTDKSIGSLRGKPGLWKDLPFLATYHPSAVLRDQSLKRTVWEDMKILKKMISGQVE